MADIRDLAYVTNSEFWDLGVAKDTNFTTVASKYTKDIFTERGFDSIPREQLGTLVNEYTQISVRVAFDLLMTENSRNPFASGFDGMIRRTAYRFGNIIQRMYMKGHEPANPPWVGLKNGDSIDNDIVRKVEIDEAFWTSNANFYDWITVPEDFQIRQIFINERGMGEMLAALLETVQDAYRRWEATNVKMCLNECIHSEKNPLQKTQVIRMESWTGNGTDAELRDNFLASVQDLADLMRVSISTGAYNSAKYRKAPDPSRMTLLVRPTLLSRIKRNLITGAFNPENLAIEGFKIRAVEDFGGLKPKIESGEPLYPVYDKYGTMVGFSLQENAETPDYDKDDDRVLYDDPNEDVLAVIIEDDLITINESEPFMTRFYNPNVSGRYQNLHAMQANVTYMNDYHRDFVLITKPSE